MAARLRRVEPDARHADPLGFVEPVGRRRSVSGACYAAGWAKPAKFLALSLPASDLDRSRERQAVLGHEGKPGGLPIADVTGKSRLH